MTAVMNTGRPRNLPAQVWQKVTRLAEEMRLTAGSQLPSVRELASTLDQNPSLIREALLHAQAAGAVRVVPRVGAFLTTTATAARSLTGDLIDVVPDAIRAALRGGDDNVLHLLDARRLIEVEMAGRAAERRRIEDLLPARKALEGMFGFPDDAPHAEYVELDIRFHVAIARLSGNDLLARMQETLTELLRPYLVDVTNPLEHQKNADQSHAAIYKALVDGNPERARHHMQEHLNLAYEALRSELEQLPMRMGAQETDHV